MSSFTQRDSVYAADDSARLWTGRNDSSTGYLNTRAINRPAGPITGKPFTGYFGTLRVDYTPDPRQLTKDIDDLGRLKGQSFDPDETVTLKFDRADLSFFLKQILGGVLSVNYLASDDIAGKVTFTTEQPIPKSQVLQVVRDVLGRSNYEMQLYDGIYQIGRHETLAAISNASINGRAGEQVTRIVRIPKGSTSEIAQFVKQLTTPDVSISSANGGGSLLIRAPASQIDQVTNLVQSLSADGFSEDKIAIIPLKRATPSRIAEELISFFRDRSGPNKQEGITVTPLETQRALLIAARDPRLMAGVRRMVEELDRASGETPSLRMVQLVNAKADDAVERLKAVFAIGDAAAKAAPEQQPAQKSRSSAPSNSAYGALRPNMQVNPAQPKANSDEGFDDGSALNTPGFSGITPSSSGTQNKGGQQPVASETIGPSSGSQLNIGPGSNIRVASDPHNNSVMIFSDYETYEKLRIFLKTIDVAEAQVVIEATIAEVSITDNLQYGVQAYLSSHGISIGSGQSSSTASPPVTGGFIGGTAQIGNVTLSGVMQALQAVTTVKVISSPYLTVINGKTARLVVGDQIPFASRTVNSTTNGTATVTTQVDTKDTGIVLEVTPRIKPNNIVSLTVDQQVSKAQDNVLTGNLTPVISNRQVKSDVIVDSGNTVLIGGLLEDRLDKTDSGVPVLRKLPIVGDAFSQQSNTSTRTELIILITPRVVRNNSEIDEVTRVLRAQMRTH